VQGFVAVRTSGVSLVPSSNRDNETGSTDSPAQITEKVASLEKEMQDLKEESAQNRQTVTEVRDNVSQILKDAAQQKSNEDAKAQDYLSGIVRLDEAVRKLEKAWQKSSTPTASSGTSTQSSESTAASTGSSVVNLNTATVAELDSLPGIGPAYAQRILDYRQKHGPYKDVRDLLNVEGIGTATLDKIKDLLTL
jgi:competence protein ComEA